MGGHAADSLRRQGRGPAAHPGTALNEEIFREHWWAAVALVARLTGDLDAAEDAVQEACALGLVKWPAEGVPSNPRAWLVSTARHNALDRLRREAKRPEKERAAADVGYAAPEAVDELGLIFMCCHPALDPEARIALTLRCVCGLESPEIAAAFLVPEPTLAQRIVRAKRRIRTAGIRLAPPRASDLPERLAGVLRVIYLVFTQGHMPRSGSDLVRADLCDQAIRLARGLAALLPGEPEVAGLLALLLLTDARREARTDSGGAVVPLRDQDRGKWDRAKIAEGTALLDAALRSGRPGPYQLHAAIAACHSAESSDWPQIAVLYGELLRYEPTAVNEANRAVAVAMADGPAAGLAILDGLRDRLPGWAQFHIARAELLREAGDTAAAARAYQAALGLGMSAPQRAFVESRAADLLARGIRVCER